MENSFDVRPPLNYAVREKLDDHNYQQHNLRIGDFVSGLCEELAEIKMYKGTCRTRTSRIFSDEFFIWLWQTSRSRWDLGERVQDFDKRAKNGVEAHRRIRRGWKISDYERDGMERSDEYLLEFKIGLVREGISLKELDYISDAERQEWEEAEEQEKKQRLNRLNDIAKKSTNKNAIA